VIGKADPARTADFLAHHPETRAFMDWMRDAPLPSSFANGSYFSINAFRFTNHAGEARHVRWSLVPPVAVNPALFALLRRAHTLLALVLFLTILMHFGAALFHAWLRRDGVFRSMVPWR
jgi:Prokaryotic cytochrome b561/Catalase